MAAPPGADLLAGNAAAGAAPAAAPPRWYAHRLNRLPAYRLAALAGALLPRAARLALARGVAAAVGPRLAAERAAVEAAMARIVPGAGPAARRALVRDVFAHFAMCFADLVAANRRRGGPECLLAGVDGEEHLAAARGGAVVLTAHVGNWELAGRLLARRLSRPVRVVVAAEADRGVERFLRGAQAPVRFVVRAGPTSVLPLVAALRRGGIVAMQGDRALGTRGDVSLPFFGAPAPFPLGPFVLARATGVPVLPSFCLLGADRRYTIAVGRPIAVEAGGEAAALARFVGVLEEVVRAHPRQWFNFFDPWSASSAS
jgi:lauroyl/myristoyl acyltransferase